jgi:hypothetical protein
MSLRNQLKVPRYGLFYFDSDKTVSVVPMKNIRKVLHGDNTSEGSIVEIIFNSDTLKAKILAVHGKFFLFMQSATLSA